jgi:hypothetical protein
VAVTSDGSRVAATLASEDYHARGVAVVIWDGATGRELRRLAVDAESVAFDPDGNLFMTAAGALQIVPPSDGAPARTLRAAGGFVRVSPDGAWAATYAGKWSTDLVITSRQGTSAVLLPSQKGTLVQHVTFALDASRLCVVTSGGGDDRPTGRTRVVVFDLVGGRWKRGATHDVGPAQQADRATMLSRAQVWIDDRIVDLSSGSSAAAPVPTEPLQIAVDGRTVLFDNGTGVGHQLVSIEDGQPRQWLEVQRPRAGAGQAEAVSARGHVVWCTAGSCVIGPPLF